MRQVLSHRGLRLVFLANLISMFGSGMNSAAVTWHILRVTHSEMNLAYLVILQTIPAMLMLPFSGAMIDREDRRRLVMLLDSGRAIVILLVAVLALKHRAELWQLYLMAMLVALGFWMFWPTINALIQELTPGADFVHSNTFLMAGVQGGWLIAGSVVGFVYNRIGLGGILLIDVATYAASFSLYFFVRRGRHVVAPPEALPHVEVMGSVTRYVHELGDGLRFLRAQPELILLGASWAMFLGAMLTQGITTAPLSDRVFHAGAAGFGWFNAAWGSGAFAAAIYAAWLIAHLGGRRSVGAAMALLGITLAVVPFTRFMPLAVVTYFVMGSGRGIAGIAIGAAIMETVPKHFMGRVQNTFYFFGMVLQLALGFSVGWMAHHHSLTAAFAMIAIVYTVGSVLTMVPQKSSVPETLPEAVSP